LNLKSWALIALEMGFEKWDDYGKVIPALDIHSMILDLGDFSRGRVWTPDAGDNAYTMSGVSGLMFASPPFSNQARG
jgi:hypothetical protein